MKTAQEINKLVAQATKRGMNVYASEAFNTIAELQYDVRVVRAANRGLGVRPTAGREAPHPVRTAIRTTDGTWLRVLHATTFAIR